VNYHEVVRKSAIRIQSRLPATYSVTSRFIESEDPKYTNDAISMMDLFLVEISDMLMQRGMNDNPVAPPLRRLGKMVAPQAATNMVNDSLDQERAMCMATHSHETITDCNVVRLALLTRHVCGRHLFAG
jgi:hypothetical protein